MRRFCSLLLACMMIMSAFLLTGCNEDSKKEKAGSEIALSEETGDLVVTTNFFELHYPAIWEDRVSVAAEEKDGVETVAFYGKVDNHDKQLLFEIVFNYSDGIVLGEYVKDKNTVSVSMNVPEFVFDETWNTDEQTTLYAMQEDVNYVVQSMSSIDGFTTAD